jgi:hypothetical protein
VRIVRGYNDSIGIRKTKGLDTRPLRQIYQIL